MPEYTFGVLCQWNASVSQWLLDGLVNVSCDDAQVDIISEKVCLTFTREAESLVHAVNQVMMSLRRANIGGLMVCEPAPPARPLASDDTFPVRAELPKVPPDLSAVPFDTLYQWRQQLSPVVTRIEAALASNKTTSFASCRAYIDWRRRAAAKKRFIAADLGRIRLEIAKRHGPPGERSIPKVRLYPLLWKFFDSFRHLEDAPPEILHAAEELTVLLGHHAKNDEEGTHE